MSEEEGKVVEDEKGIKEYSAKKIVLKIGTGGHILMPKKLLGKLVAVRYVRNNNKKGVKK